jgi:hypothetical protein
MSLKTSQRFRVLYFVSPFVVCILYCLIGFIVDRYTFTGDTREWSHLAAALFFPSIFILGSMSLLVRFATQNNLLKIWIIESSILALLVFIFNIWF